MAGSFSQELEDLLNPLPKFADPEDGDADEATKARVVERLGEDDGDGDDDVEDGASLSALRKHNTTLLSDTDRRYVGKAVSRKQLLMDIEGSGEEEEEDDDGDDDEEEEDAEELEADEDDESRADEEADGDEDDLQDDEEEEEKVVGGDMTFPQGMDFRKLTEGMDDLGVSEEDDDDDDDESGEETEGSDEDEGSDDEEREDGDGTVRTFSQEKVEAEVEKGRAVKNQLALWDQLLEGRIKIQKALATANRLPQPQTFPEFRRRGGPEFAGALKTTHKALKALQRSLLELHEQLLGRSPDTRAVVLGGAAGAGDEEIPSDDGGEEEEAAECRAPKRKLEMAEYPELMAKRFAAFRPYCDATLQRWHDKTRLATGRGGGGGGGGKGFGAFERNILTQVEQVLMDRERLLRRTRTRRSEYRVLGKREAAPGPAPGPAPDLPEEGEGAGLKANPHLRDLDEDAFDDDDFYHQLLRELIERRTSAADPNDQVAMGRQWLAIQKLRSKIKKKVDTKASKGRKVRFHVHSKLLNFMAPVDRSPASDEARSELYRGLFGQSAAPPTAATAARA